ncbi:antibiotic biosynthesis monooxygenase family protein [Streptomyces noursei]|uniref:antibiotic biosynthesis monooxygenase family protein n=1 Tax=Streptomyces noursei TaxID=1971 RepID=UPI0035D8B4A1
MPSVVKINVLTVPAEQRETLEQRFASRAHAVESSDGFEWFELLRPVEGTDNYLVYTRWPDYSDSTFCRTASPPGHLSQKEPRLISSQTGLSRCC